MKEIYVVDTETTGLDGYPYDFVVDIGIARADLTHGIVENVYSSVVGYDTSEWDDERTHSWIFSNSDLTLEDVQNAPALADVCRDVRRILNGKIVTSYNEEFDFGKFLFRGPWSLKEVIGGRAPDIMTEAFRVDEIECRVRHDGTRAWPRLEKAYAYLCPDDPAGINGVQDHRALSDAVAAAHVMLRLFRLGKYDF